MTVGAKNKGIKEAVTLLRPYNEGRHGDWDNYSSLKGNNKKDPIGGQTMNSYIENWQNVLNDLLTRKVNKIIKMIGF